MLLNRVAWFDGRRLAGACGTGDAAYFIGASLFADCVLGMTGGGSLVVDDVRGPIICVLGGNGYAVVRAPAELLRCGLG